MISHTHLIIDVDDNDQGKCKPSCLGFDARLDMTNFCKHFKCQILEMRRCDSCLHPEIYEEQINEWIREMASTPVTQHAVRNISRILGKAVIISCAFDTEADILHLNIRDINADEYFVVITSESIRVARHRKDVVTYYWQPWKG